MPTNICKWQVRTINVKRSKDAFQMTAAEKDAHIVALKKNTSSGTKCSRKHLHQNKKKMGFVKIVTQNCRANDQKEETHYRYNLSKTVPWLTTIYAARSAMLMIQKRTDLIASSQSYLSTSKSVCVMLLNLQNLQMRC